MNDWRCERTGNPVGTDTVMIGAPACTCRGCRGATLEAEVQFWVGLTGEAVDALDECAGDDEDGWDRQQHAETAAERIRAKYKSH